jgi:uncharacterized protein
MKKTIDIRLLPEDHQDIDKIELALSEALGCEQFNLPPYQLIRRSVDARKYPIQYQLRFEIFSLDQSQSDLGQFSIKYSNQKDKSKVVIIGAGPAGYFAALELIELGMKPIILERGKDVRARRRDLKAILQEGIVNQESNYCFGEGGAGTYSDGKLYTRSSKRGSIEKVLNVFVKHGASTDILIDAHPHIGTNKLPGIVTNMRDSIVSNGGEVHFNAKLTDFVIKNGQLVSIIYNEKESIETDKCILATGHSARDIYHIFNNKGYLLYAKPFALGLRIEHPQKTIDQIQYKTKERGAYLPPSSYSLACQVRQRGVFSFCMCPGGLIVPAATSPGEIVVNGMSPSRRDSPFANSGIVVAIENEDLSSYSQYGALSNMYFQQNLEQTMFRAGDGSQKAPALRVVDFIKNRISDTLPSSSYIPGLFAAPLYELLPHFISSRLKEGLKIFGKRMPMYLSEESILVGTESRTSAPVQIPRDIHTLMHPEIIGMYPCGEGAGFAGGIVSAAMDGIRVANQIFKHSAI